MKRTLLCDRWEFCKMPLGTEYDDTDGWRETDLPHDWLIYDTRDLYEDSTGWYRRKLIVPADGMRRALRFEGVYTEPRIYVNGVLAFEWKYGYTTFEADITDFLHEGENLIAVRADHRAPNSRWYSGAGIYRKVWLCEYSTAHILSDGVYVCADTDGTVRLTAEVERPDNMTVDRLSLKAVITEHSEHGSEHGAKQGMAESFYSCTAVDKSTLPAPVVRDGCKYSVNTLTMKVNDPILWDIDNPYLYTYSVGLYLDGELTDVVSGSFGFRKTELTPDRGFFLNDRHVKLRGACMHHDLGALGAAMNDHALRRQLEKLRTMGVNAIRTSHNPPSVELLELADEMGFLILDEAFDMWELSKTKYDYSRFFNEWAERDVAAWVRRDRNHPCVIGWSIGNEIADNARSERGQEITSKLKMLVEQHDPEHNGFVTQASNWMMTESAQKCADILKIAGYNYLERLYEQHHAAHPDWAVFGSETSSVVASRGIYHFPLSQSVLCEDDEQCSALGNIAPPWAARSIEDCIIPDRDAAYCAGQFIWTGFDYIGEPTPYTTKNSYFGQFDTAGFEKDGAYMFRSAWTDCRTSPFIHIFPHWDFNEGELIDVRVATNAPRAALFFNGERIAVEDFDRACGRKLTLDARLPYSKGVLEAIAYDEQGREIARDTVRSFGDAAKLCLTPDKTVLKANGRDMIFVEISACDSEGTFVANANNRVQVEVSGAGRLVGLDNGDSTDYDSYKGISRRLFSGKLLAMIAAKNMGGSIQVRVSSEGLPDAELTLSAVEISPEEFIATGFPFSEENKSVPLDCGVSQDEIPIRRIDLSGEGRRFTADTRHLTFSVKLLPENTTYDDIEYRIVAPTGIVTDHARIVSAGDGKVTVEALGDGEFRLRALAKNGTDKYHIMSDLTLTAEGIGKLYKDPYRMVQGGLFSLWGGKTLHGFRKGAAIEEGAWAGFEDLDFGEKGTHILTVSIYTEHIGPMHFSVYDGTPDSGVLIGSFTFFEERVPMTHRSATYKLLRPLRGVHTISFLAGAGMDLEGFYFGNRPKEFSEIAAAAAEEISGKGFKAQSEAVTGLKENASLEFGEFDFTARAPERLVIRGRSKQDFNSFMLCFMTKDGKEKRIPLEFDGSGDYTEQSFRIHGINGIGTVRFVFGRGCDMDMLSFRFE